ncbi:MAG: hypothetical protein H6810_04320 [Phycisphaeraceae bacterium]|nr:MAG: hypothetical protein H6810_04320 [Phycisphaeraceae bacterium]
MNPVLGSHRPDRCTTRSRSARTVLALGLLLVGFGCSKPEPKASKPSDQTINEALKLFKETEAAPSTPQPEADESTPGFAILLTRVPPRLASQPELARQQVADAFGTEAGRVTLLNLDADRLPLIVYGRYGDPAAPRAQADLAKIRAMEVDGRAPFARAIMVPTGEKPVADAKLARYDLRNAKKMFGDSAVYTLQIGAYAREDNQRPTPADFAAFRKAAEEAVAQLRREGEQAFFYHGPNGSMVTVGIFDDTDLDTSVTPPLESARLNEVRDRHPDNLLNGRGVREMIRGEDGKTVPHMQESRLVVIPG